MHSNSSSFKKCAVWKKYNVHIEVKMVSWYVRGVCVSVLLDLVT